MFSLTRCFPRQLLVLSCSNQRDQDRCELAPIGCATPVRAYASYSPLSLACQAAGSRDAPRCRSVSFCRGRCHRRPIPPRLLRRNADPAVPSTPRRDLLPPPRLLATSSRLLAASSPTRRPCRPRQDPPPHLACPPPGRLCLLDDGSKVATWLRPHACARRGPTRPTGAQTGCRGSHDSLHAHGANFHSGINVAALWKLFGRRCVPLTRDA